MKHNIFTEYVYSSRSMKRREGVFLPKAQKRYVRKVSCIVKNWITNSSYITFKTVKHYTLCSANITSNIPNVSTTIAILLLKLLLQLRLVVESQLHP
jgi:hypothetical protein